MGKHSNIECTLSGFLNITKGRSTGSADTAEGVISELCRRTQPRLAHRLSCPAPPRARCVESSRMVLVVLHTFLLPVPVHSLPVSSVLSITISVDQLQQDQNFVLKLLVCRSGSPRRPRRKPLQAVRESDEWEGTVTQSVYSKFSKTCIKGGSTGSADTAEGVKKRTFRKTTARACDLPAGCLHPLAAVM